jgi:hypothetical protein
MQYPDNPKRAKSPAGNCGAAGSQFQDATQLGKQDEQ